MSDDFKVIRAFEMSQLIPVATIEVINQSSLNCVLSFEECLIAVGTRYAMTRAALPHMTKIKRIDGLWFGVEEF